MVPVWSIRVASCGALLLLLASAVPANAACPPFTLQPKFPTTTVSGPVEVAAADFTGDGIPDLAVTESASGRIEVLTGPGGTFGTKIPIFVGGTPFGIVTGDLDADGYADLVIGNIGANTVQVVRGLGSGTFAAPVSFPAGTGPYEVALGDFNSDGVPDVAVADNGEARIRILIAGKDGAGHWDGTFAPAVAYPTSKLSLAIVVGDFTNDGILDVAATEYSDGTVALFIGNGSGGIGDGTFKPPLHVGSGSPEPYDLATGDLNEDGRLDLVIANGGDGGIRVLLGSGTGFFPVVDSYLLGVNTTGVAVADLDSDGISDLLVSSAVDGRLYMLRGLGSGGVGSGTFMSPINQTDCCFNVHVIAADLDVDGNPDAVTSGYSSNTLSIFMDGCGLDPTLPAITDIRDVPNDQGGKVFLTWTKSSLDQTGGAVNAYRVWRQIPPGLVADQQAARAAAAEPDRFQRQVVTGRDGATTIVYWEALATLPAQRLPGYGYTAATTQDSLPGSNPYFTYYVSALTSNIDVFYDSAPDSGYSVDNLSPAAPAALTANVVAEGLHLHWQANAEADLAKYELHRSNVPGFTPSPATLIATPTTNDYVDASPDPSATYRLAAVDAHTNHSAYTSLATSGVTGVGTGRPGTTWLAAPSPNPALGPLDLRYALARPERMRLLVFDAQGRCVRTLVDGARPAGEATVRWDATDDTGAPARAGLYWLELRVAAQRIVQRFSLVR